MGRQHSDYPHFFAPAIDKGDYPRDYKFTLIETFDQYCYILELNKDAKEMALDTETTGLDHSQDKMIGFSFTFDGVEGFYVPIAHAGGNIDSIIKVLGRLSTFIRGKMVYYYNKRFDLRMMEKHGIDINEHNAFDVTCLVWLADTNIKMPSLKWAEKHFLGWDAPEFDEVFSAGAAQLTRPIDATQYACTDALGTFRLAKRLPSLIPECGFIARLDNKTLDVVKIIEETPLLIDREYLEKNLPLIDAKIRESLADLYRQAGRTFNPGSTAEVRQVLIENGCAPAEKTPKGMVSTRFEHIQRVKHPVADALIEWRHWDVLRRNFCQKLLDEANIKDGHININHLLFNVPTGRFSTGSSKRNPFFSRINIQAIIKSPPQFYKPNKLDNINEGIYGWGMEPCEEDDEGAVEGFKQEFNMRSAIVPPKDFLWVSIDYKAQELRLPANFSHEPVFLKAFLNNEDIHKVVAQETFKGVPYSNKIRKRAKIMNFGLMFLGNEWTIANQMNCPIEEAADYKDRYEKTHKTLYLWKKAVIKSARRNGYVKTYYGRPRRLRKWFASPNWRENAFGKRSAVNSVVQGTAADIMRIALIRIWDKLYKKQGIKLKTLPESYDNVDFLFHPLVHDEINFVVRISKLHEIVPKLIDLMTVQEKDWPVPMEVEVSLGDSWGNIIPFKLENGEFVPDA